MNAALAQGTCTATCPNLLSFRTRSLGEESAFLAATREVGLSSGSNQSRESGSLQPLLNLSRYPIVKDLLLALRQEREGVPRIIHCLKVSKVLVPRKSARLDDQGHNARASLFSPPQDGREFVVGNKVRGKKVRTYEKNCDGGSI